MNKLTRIAQSKAIKIPNKIDHEAIANKAISTANKRMEENPKNPQLTAIFNLALNIWARNHGKDTK